MKANFKIPQTKQVIVRWVNAAGRFIDTLIPRPANNDALRLVMLNQQVGYSQIRCVKPVHGEDLTQAVNRNFGRRARA